MERTDYFVNLYLDGALISNRVCATFEEAQDLGQRWREKEMDIWNHCYDYTITTEPSEYTGDHYVGEIIDFKGKYGTHKCKITRVWNADGQNGVSIIPTGNYGFEIDVFEEQL